MYGIVNKSIEELVTEKFGEAKWLEIKEHSKINIDYFLSSEIYDDNITYSIAGSISEVIGVSLSQVLILFGEWWIIDTTNKKYGAMLHSGGSNLRDFLIALPNFHNRVMMMYPKITPPEFLISAVETNSLNVHYHSKREGLADFVQGLLQGLGKLYDQEIEIELLQSRAEGNNHEIFKVTLK